MENTLSGSNWLTLIASSAVISALVNISWNAWSKYQDKKSIKEKEALRIKHIYLDIVFQLELFAKRCNAQIYEIDRALHAYLEDHDNSAISKLQPLQFEFDAKLDWTKLPLQFTADVKSFPELFKSTSSWIGTQFIQWADIQEAFTFEEEQLAYYGLFACDTSRSIRQEKIKIKPQKEEDYEDIFHSIIKEAQRKFTESSGQAYLIPELASKFKKIAIK